MVDEVRLENVWNRRDRALRIRRVIVTGAGHGVASSENMNLPVRVLEAESAAGDDWNGVFLVVDALEVCDLERSPVNTSAKL